uniref:Ig-like domain-containing protein n=1 Tax=Tetraodon nigroviridis TaxID=99883 RepID=H3C1D8_TETNG
MKKIGRLEFAFLLAVLSCAPPADGDVIVGKPGGRVAFRCGLPRGSGPPEWYHQGNVVYREDARTGFRQKCQLDICSRITVRQMTLEIRDLKETDAGKFTCKNNGGSEEHQLIVITVSASPSASLQLGSTATLQCQVIGPNPEPEVRWKKPDGSLYSGSKDANLKEVARSDEGTWNCTFDYQGRQYGETLDIRVIAPPPAPVTSRGPGPNPPCKDCGSPSRCFGGPNGRPVGPSPSPLLGLSWWMWVVIGVGCLIVLVLVVFIICLYKRIQRKKRKLRRMENSRQLLMNKQYCQCDRPAAAPKPQQRRLREKRSAPPRH